MHHIRKGPRASGASPIGALLGLILVVCVCLIVRAAIQIAPWSAAQRQLAVTPVPLTSTPAPPFGLFRQNAFAAFGSKDTTPPPRAIGGGQSNLMSPFAVGKAPRLQAGAFVPKGVKCNNCQEWAKQNARQIQKRYSVVKT